MDGLRLALLILGIVVVAVVYFWTSRRRRYEREAGDFDRFDAWTNEDLDPLAPPGADPEQGLADYDDVAVDPDELTQPNLRLSAVRRALGRSEKGDPRADDSETDSLAESASAQAAPLERSDDVRNGVEHVRADHADGYSVSDEAGPAATSAMDHLGPVAESAPERLAPRVGSLDEIELDAQPPEPAIAAPRADSSRRSAEDEAGLLSTKSEPPPSVQKPARQTQEQNQAPNRAAEREAPPQGDDAQDPADLVIVLNVMAPSGGTFEGPSLKSALETAGLKPGDMQLYHYRTQAQSADSAPIFSALNVVKPGTLGEDEFDGMRTPGIAMVLRLQGIERPSEAFELMLGAARSIADELDGQVCDETRSTLTGQALNHLRERITTAAFRARAGS